MTMVLASLGTTLDNAGTYATNHLLPAVLLITGTILLTRFANWLSDRITDRIDAKADEGDALVRSEALKYRHSVTQVLTWTILVVVYCGVAVLVFEQPGFSDLPKPTRAMPWSAPRRSSTGTR